MADTMLNVVDEQDNVIGQELRSVIHRTGLRHREIHVWFLTEQGDLIFQRRGPDKDTFPNLLDATAGGHVEDGQDYLAAALAEVQEETGLAVTEVDLIPLAKIDTQQTNGSSVNNVVFRMIYLYRFAGRVEDLEVEQTQGAGFESIPLQDVLQRPEGLAKRTVPGVFREPYQPAWQALQKTLAA